ncbi:MAG: SDR family NAD(P)-dependent oxidoreductase [Steroidobacteraceae bacterium]
MKQREAVHISGGTSGINLGIAKGFAQQGDKVLISGRNETRADAAAQSIRSESGAMQ